MSKILYSIVFISIGFFLFSLVSSTKASAATRTWTGDASGFFSNPDNWDGPLVNGDDLVFPPGVGNYSPTNDLVELQVNSITTLAGGYEILGNEIGLSDYLQVDSDVTTIGIDILLLDNVTIEAVSNYAVFVGDVDINSYTLTFDTGGSISFSGEISGTGTVEKIGSEYLIFNSSHTFIGDFNILDGNLDISSANATGSSTNTLTIGDGINTVSLITHQDDSVTPGTNVVIQFNGAWLLEDSEHNINRLTGEGIVNTNTGLLQIGNGSGNFEFAGHIQGSGTISKIGDSTVTFSGDSSGFVGTLLLDEGTTIINGDMSNTSVEMTDGVLYGTGYVGYLLADSGTISPGTGPNISGVLTARDSLTLIASDIFYMADINGTTAGVQYDQLVVEGDISLSGATLELSVGFTPTLGDSFTIVSSSGNITGTFDGLPNNSSFTQDGQGFKIEYTNTEVILTYRIIPQQSNLSINPSLPKVGQTITISSTWTGSEGTPTGIIEFYIDGEMIGFRLMSNGTATLVLNSAGILEAGEHTIFVQYSGDDNYSSAYSSTIVFTLYPVDPPPTQSSTPNVVVNTTPIQTVATFVSENIENESKIETESEIDEPLYTLFDENKSDESEDNNLDTQIEDDSKSSNISKFFILLLLITVLVGVYIYRITKKNSKRTINRDSFFT